MKRCRWVMCCFTLVLGWMMAWGTRGQAEPKGKAGEDTSHSLHVIVLQGEKDAPPPQTPVAVIPLANADLPERISKAILQPPGSTSLALPGCNLPGRVLVLDIHTIQLPDPDSPNSKPQKHENGVAGLRYSVKLRRWAEDSCEIELTGKYGRNPFTPLPVSLSRRTTTLVHPDPGGPLVFAFTFLDAVPLIGQSQGHGDREGNPEPAVVTRPAPEVPAGLAGMRKSGTFSVAAIITPQGRVDPARWVIRECTHPLFARSAMKTILNSWKFIPAKVDGTATAALATIEVMFTAF